MLVQWTCQLATFFFGENMMVFNNLKRKPVKTTLYALLNSPSIFIEATRLPAWVLLRFLQSLGRNSLSGTKRQSENPSQDKLKASSGNFVWEKKASNEQPRGLKKSSITASFSWHRGATFIHEIDDVRKPSFACRSYCGLNLRMAVNMTFEIGLHVVCVRANRRTLRHNQIFLRSSVSNFS